jgi:hypothetical protein
MMDESQCQPLEALLLEPARTQQINPLCQETRRSFSPKSTGNASRTAYENFCCVNVVALGGGSLTWSPSQALSICICCASQPVSGWRHSDHRPPFSHSRMLPLFIYVAIGAWIGGVVVSFISGNRKLPLLILLLGIGLLIATFAGHAGAFGIAGIAILAVIIWITIQADTA